MEMNVPQSAMDYAPAADYVTVLPDQLDIRQYTG
jgi:hypothetical protein